METANLRKEIKSRDTLSPTCYRCEKSKKVRKREFSAQAISALVMWQEIDQKSMNKGICNECYSELREILIENVEEVGNIVPETQRQRVG